MPKQDFNESYMQITEAIKKSRDSARKRIESNKQVLFDVFDAKGVSGAEVKFDGSGDSGGTDDVELWKLGNSKPFENQEEIFELPVKGVKIYSGMSFGPDGCHDMFDESPANVKGLIESICYDALKAEHEGWENNDGAYGSIEFDSETRTISLEFYQRSTEFFEHEF